MNGSAQTGSADQSNRRIILISGIILIMTAMLIWRGVGGEIIRWATWVGVATIFASALPYAGLREKYLFSLCIGATLIAFLVTDSPWFVVAKGLDQAAFLMAFILLLTILFETALTSPSVAKCGEHIARLPPLQRHAGLFWGTNVMAVLFNLGIVSLLSPLVKRGLPTTGDPHIREDMERRQVSAILRGFAWGVVWSPTALAPIALFELIDGIDRLRWTYLGLILAFMIFLLSALEDGIFGRKVETQEVISESNHVPWQAYGQFSFAVFSFLLLALGLSSLTGEGLVFGLMASCPIMMFGWLAVQNSEAGLEKIKSTKIAVGKLLTGKLPLAANVAVTLACSGYLGRVAAALIPAEFVQSWLSHIDMPHWLLLSLLPVVITVASWLAVSPIMFAVFFGALFGALPELPVDATLLALSLSCGWALSMTFSPFSTVVLMLSRQNEIPSTRLTLNWNFYFAPACVFLLVVVFFFLTGGK